MASAKAVAYGYADATIGVAAVMQSLIGELGLTNIAISGEAKIQGMAQYSLHFGVRNDWPELVSLLDKAIASLSYQELQQLRQRWLMTQPLPRETAHRQQPLAVPEIVKSQTLFTEEELNYLNQRVIRMCIDPDWMPFERLNPAGAHIGMASELLAIAQQRTGVQLQLVPTRSWSESLEFAKGRKCDILSLAMATPERLTYMNFTSPYISFPFVIATRSEEIFIERLEDVLDKPLGMVKGYAYAELLRIRYPDLQLHEVESVSAGLRKVQNGEIYGYIDALAPIAYTLQSEGVVDVKIAGKFDDKWELAVGVRNDHPLLLSIMQKVVATIDERETREVYNHWFSVKLEQGTDYRLIGNIVAVALLILLVMFIWVHRIQAERARTQEALEKLSLAQAELEKKNLQLQQQANSDALTGLSNRLYLDAILLSEYQRSQRYGSHFGVILLDIDHFKRVNDSYGHPVGDEVLVAMAAILKAGSRLTDTVGRWGGEEFLLICPAAQLIGLGELAEKLRSVIAAHNFSHVGHCTASFGVALYQQGERLETLVSRADSALYRAKAAGRNRVEVDEGRA
ncbi:MAG: diguanylate cyclase [Gammaproteobacteria bacterium]|nr:diguanylate cyclase [Gammaproteobacteria bacterium]